MKKIHPGIFFASSVATILLDWLGMQVLFSHYEVEDIFDPLVMRVSIPLLAAPIILIVAAISRSDSLKAKQNGRSALLGCSCAALLMILLRLMLPDT